ncbi:diacylglycerol kinase family protein [Treponema sp.]|uniref:diacylglycerol/lipid kinase family protein n=1 Tax=Treponema sp. TaxID=166 RepID=UPI0025DE1F8C|nr:YegS/Rv2252/BmrU family lipid kinase [Treponema sp.]MCR5218472.1 YegS/Rv2252/BmrU family lipid kinase [Treponema sp.]
MYYFIINKTGGSGKSVKRWKKLSKFLDKNHIQYKVLYSEYVMHAKKIAADLCSLNDPDINIIVVGGDGTLNEVINGITDFSKISLSIIPAGSGNDFSRQFKIPRHQPVKAFKKIQKTHDSGIKKYIDIGRAQFCNQEGQEKDLLFSISSGMGFDALICEKNDSSKIKKALNKLHMGKFSYLAISLQTIFLMKPFKAKVHFEDQGKSESLDFNNMVFLAAMNFKAEGGGIKMSPMARPDDGCFTVCAVHNVKKPLLLFKFAQLTTGLHVFSKNFMFRDTSCFTIEAENPVTVHTDGEFFPNVRKIHYTCLHNKLSVLV